MLRRKTTLSMSFVFFVVWIVLLGGQGVRSLDAAGVGRDNAVVEVRNNPPYTIVNDSTIPPKIQPLNNTPTAHLPIVNNSTIQQKIQLLNNTSTAPLPMTCKDITAVDSRVVVTLADGFEVLCDTDTDGGGWIVFQRRLSSDVDFYRDWANCKYGFGDIRGNFWLGNEKIHRLTFQRRYTLRIDFTFNGNSYFAEYSNFRIFGEEDKYQLEVEGYSGNAGDNFGVHNGFAFSTTDRDNDNYAEGNCVAMSRGVWWYSGCHNSNLNGVWGSTVYGQGLNWLYTTSLGNTATSSEMKIRPFY